MTAVRGPYPSSVSSITWSGALLLSLARIVARRPAFHGATTRSQLSAVGTYVTGGLAPQPPSKTRPRPVKGVVHSR